MNSAPLIASALTKRFGDTTALDHVDWCVPSGSVVGLVGRNGCGKTTLLHTALGLFVPDAGSCVTLGVEARHLDDARLARIGFVDQEAHLLDWLTVEQHVRYVASFHPHWDLELERRLRPELQLEERKRVLALSRGMRQRLALLLAVCHRPRLLLLDEPVSALDPLAREDALRMILERVIEDGATVIVSSHVLHDVEKIVDRLLFLDAGRVVEDAPLDELKEAYAEWLVHSPDRDLPRTFAEPYVLARDGDGRTARLTVRASAEDLDGFRTRHGVQVERRALDLEHIYPLVTGERRP